MTLVSRQRGFIYLSGGKCATTSITAVLESLVGDAVDPARRNPWHWYRYDHHMPAVVVRRWLGTEEFARCFKFSFVRNPYDWVVSTFFYLAKIGRFPAPRNGRMGPEDFARVIKYLRSPVGRRHMDVPIRTQFDFLADGGQMLTDYLGRFEALPDSWFRVCDRLDLPRTPLPRLNVSTDRSYREHYSDETRGMVGCLWARDIEAFSYDF
jgi:hypothetical protein